MLNQSEDGSLHDPSLHILHRTAANRLPSPPSTSPPLSLAASHAILLRHHQGDTVHLHEPAIFLLLSLATRICCVSLLNPPVIPAAA